MESILSNMPILHPTGKRACEVRTLVYLTEFKVTNSQQLKIISIPAHFVEILNISNSHQLH